MKINYDVLIREMGNGNELAFRQVYDAHWDTVYHFLRKSSGSAKLAEDLAQSIFAEVWLNKGRFSDLNSLKHFLALESRNQTLRVWRQVFKLSRSMGDTDQWISAWSPEQQEELIRLARMEGKFHQTNTANTDIQEETSTA